MDDSMYAEIIVDNMNTNTDKLFTYIVPNKYINVVRIGMRVLVPFGIGNKLIEGIIISTKQNAEVNIKRLKYIDSIINEPPVLSENMIKLSLWMKENYLAQHIEALRTILPTGITNKVRKYLKISLEKDDRKISEIKNENQLKLIKLLINNGETEVEKIKEISSIKNLQANIDYLAEKGIVEITNKVSADVNIKHEKYVHRNFSTDEANDIISSINSRAYKQLELIKYLSNKNNISLKQVLIDTDSSLYTLKSLEEKGYLTIQDREVCRNPVTSEIKPYYKVNLSQDQKICVDTIFEDYQNRGYNKFLLHGVTGSGKTEVYLQLIEKYISLNKQAIVLVPEISLTPQTVERFVGRFGNNVAVMHSRLSPGERYDEWRKIREGKVQIVVGARSAVFAPLGKLGLIIIDEEHETSYKSSMNPKYCTIEVADKRCELENATLLLGSATPSIETYYRAQNGDIKLLTLPNRINNKKMPSIEIIDMKSELDDGNKSIFSKKLYDAISENLIQKKQTILFLNRRGFSTFVSCRKCGYVVKCKSCDISLTYHLKENILKCHYCGNTMRPPTVCPDCGSQYIKYFGIGTQKVEEIVKKYFPDAKVARMDVDTTTKKGSHERILGKVRDGSVDILIGTQMISKGLDFPNVTLVGIIAADISLNLPDFKASERTFQLLTQVGGRAGRGEAEGKVILQTYEPDHYSIMTAKSHDYESFYNKEIVLRKAFEYPPFTNIINIIVYNKDEKKAYDSSKIISHELKKQIAIAFGESKINKVIGPNEAPIYKIKDRYRRQILIKCDGNEFSLIKDIVYRVCILNKKKLQSKETKISIDINPISIL
ncbi:primosomal protein N' [Brassicibacter mesophilus]|uniref:primosomal protein N' n=1 Tax=Brassicibacter mesophilus TaxID=745119 RepID=UPI003D1AD1DB